MLHKNSRSKPMPAAKPLARPTPRRFNWRLMLGGLLTAGILLFAFFNRAWIIEALGLARAAKPAWLLLAFIVILASFLISSQVFHVALHSLGYRVGVLQLWAEFAIGDASIDLGRVAFVVNCHCVVEVGK